MCVLKTRTFQQARTGDIIMEEIWYHGSYVEQSTLFFYPDRKIFSPPPPPTLIQLLIIIPPSFFELFYLFFTGTTEDFYDEGISDPYPMIIERAARAIGNKIFYNAHFFFRDNLQIQRTHTYINQVREPVSRYISHYAYMHNKRHRPVWRIRKMIENGEFNQTNSASKNKAKGAKTTL